MAISLSQVNRTGKPWPDSAQLRVLDPQLGSDIGAAVRLQVFAQRLMPWLMMLGAWSVPGHAQFVQRLNAGPNATEGVMYGFAVASHREWVAVGELSGLSGGSPVTSGGAVELWRWQGGAMVRAQRLLSPQPGGGHQFGRAIAMTAGRLAVVERGPYGEVGVVHVHGLQGGTWHWEAALTPPVPAPGMEIASVALMGDWLLAGMSTAWQASNGAPGQVVVWQKDGADWIIRQVLHPLDSSVGDGFGLRLAIAATASSASPRLAIGAPFRSSGRGGVYVFTLTGGSWQQEQRLLLSPSVVDEFFGFAVAIHGEVVAGGTLSQASTAAAGRVGVWQRSGSGDFPWVSDEVFAGAEAQSGDRFGSALALPTERDLVVGAPGLDLSPPIGPTLLDAGRATSHGRRRFGAVCAPAWSLGGGVGHPAALPRAETFFGFAVASDRLVAVGAPTGEVSGVGRAGFVDVSMHDRLLYSGLDCLW